MYISEGEDASLKRMWGVDRKERIGVRIAVLFNECIGVRIIVLLNDSSNVCERTS